MPLLIGIIILFFILWSAIGSSQVVRQPRYQPPITPEEFHLPWESLNLLTADKIHISGWLIRHLAPQGILLFLHGYGTSKADLLDLAQAVYSQGPYHLILIDFRGHGYSGGSVISFGREEIKDVQAVLDFVAADQSLTRLPVGCLGISMGGSIAILAAAQFQRIQAVVSDSAYSELGQAIARGIWMSYHIPWFPLGQFVIWWTELRLKCAMKELSPVYAIGKIAPRPILIIHGAQDKTTLVSNARDLFESAAMPKEIWCAPDSEHVGVFFKQREEYLNRVFRFFENGLRRAS